jgi:four helix bundle protein
MHGITGQVRRAAISIPLNVAEGSGRSKKEFANYLGRARASVHECVSLLEIARRQKLIESKEHESFYGKCEELARMLSGLLRSLS